MTQAELLGPDVSDEPDTREIVIENQDEVWAMQFVNRWVFLKHHRPIALRELLEQTARLKARKGD